MTQDDIIKALDWHAPTVEMGSQSLLRRIESLVAQAEAAERERIKAANAPVIENINRHLRHLSELLAEIHAIRARSKE